ncbi:MAG TPA: hypothetical protein VHH73_09105, partial [Verrucomicrobiae bacterium]|nr:hypothetical protein [Verrucomicrobiae bacterium]
TLTFLKLMALSKMKIAVATLVVAGVATSWWIERQAAAGFRADNETLRQQLVQLAADRDQQARLAMEARRARSPRFPVPAANLSSTATANGPEEPGGARLMALMNNPPTVTVDRLQSYLDANKSNATSMLAAYRVTHDSKLLEEDLKLYPRDPHVAFEALRSRDAAPEDRRRWLDTLKQGAPENALGYYLSAVDYARAGDNDAALREVITATGKGQFQDYAVQRIQDDHEAYLEAGFSPADAKQLASSQETLPQLAPLKELGKDLVTLAQSYRQAGDEASAQSVLQMVASMGQRYSLPSPGEPEISQLVGMVVERKALEQMDPNAAFGNDGQTVQQRLDQLNQQEKAVRELGKQAEQFFPIMSETDMGIYKDRWMSQGEEAAMRWVVGKYGGKPAAP